MHALADYGFVCFCSFIAEDEVPREPWRQERYLGYVAVSRNRSERNGFLRARAGSIGAPAPGARPVEERIVLLSISFALFPEMAIRVTNFTLTNSSFSRSITAGDDL
jgi:hypothetical protein